MATKGFDHGFIVRASTGQETPIPLYDPWTVPERRARNVIGAD